MRRFGRLDMEREKGVGEVMPHSERQSPIACRTDALTEEERGRRSEVLSLIRARAHGCSETEDGIVFEWAGDASLPALVGEFVSLESRCCPFIRFAIGVEAEGGPVSLRLGGREGVKEFLLTTFVNE